MIKVTLTGSNPDPMFFNPRYLIFAIARSDHTTQIRLMNGDSYTVIENVDIINDQVIAWQHRTHHL